MIEFKIFGDWTAVQRGLQSLPRDIKEGAKEAQEKIAKSLVRTVKRHINAQDLGWKTRSDSTRSNDPRTLVDTGAYYRAIKAFKKWETWYAGVPRSAKDSRGQSIGDYAILLEEGTKDMPGRRLWKPSIKEVANNKLVKGKVKEAIFKKIRHLQRKGFSISYL